MVQSYRLPHERFRPDSYADCPNSDYLCVMKQQTQFHIVSGSTLLSDLFPVQTGKRTLIGYVHFVLALRGEAWVEIDGHNLRLQKGSFLFLLPHVQLRRISQTDDFRYDYLFFAFDYLADFPLLLKTDVSDKAMNMPHYKLNTETFALIKTYLNLINERQEYTEVTKGLLFSLIVEISRIYTNLNIATKISRQDELADNFFRLLHKHYKKEHTATFYADRLCVTDKHLMRTIKARTGRTFHFWLSDFLMREAKFQLRSTDKSVTQIAEELNFPNSSFFARFFRKHIGVTPLQFRKS